MDISQGQQGRLVSHCVAWLKLDLDVRHIQHCVCAYMTHMSSRVEFESSAFARVVDDQDLGLLERAKCSW